MRALDANLPFALYLAALVVLIAGYVSNKKALAKAGDVVLGVGLAAQLVFLGWRWVEAGRAPMSNMHESLLVLAAGLVASFFYFNRKGKFSFLSGWVAAAALLVLGIAALMDPQIKPLMPALQSNWLLYHVSITMFGYGAFMVAFVAALAWIWADKRSRGLERERMLDFSHFIYRATSAGFLLLTGGIILGSVWANEAWGSYWSWDPKETWSLITWLYYAVVIHLWRTRGWRDLRFAWISVVGMAFVMFTYFGVNYLLTGLHSYSS